MIIITEICTPRLTYVLDYVFNQRLGIGYEIVQPGDFSRVNQSEPVLTYSWHSNQTVCKIYPEGVLQEDFFHHGKPSISYLDHLPVLFADTKTGGLGFDIFAAIFWMLSRYEEYQPFTPDEHGRFPASASLICQNKLETTPLVDHWIIFLKSKLIDHFSNLKFKEETFAFLPTIDIDSPWSYKNKGLKRNIGGLLRDAMQRKFQLVTKRLSVLAGIQSDPFFTFHLIDDLHKKYQIEAQFFILLGLHNRFDKTISHKNNNFRIFIKDFIDKHQLGLHPSYVSANNSQRFNYELRIFEEITGKKVGLSRQHFLKIKLPDYYQMLIELEIYHDYSLGFAERPGFRAGTSRPFSFYDLKKECHTPLVIYPLVLMDVSLLEYMKLTPSDAMALINQLVQQVRLVNGIFISLWHNESFDFTDKWKEWETVYEHLLKTATEK